MSRRLLVLWLVVCAGLLGSARSLFALEFVYPADKTFVLRSDYLIIKGGANPPLDGMVLDINGVASDMIDVSSPEYRQTFADFLILQPELAVGKNSLTVKGYAGGKEVATRSATVFYVNGDASLTPPGGFKPYVLHTAEREALCAPCHNMKPDKVQLESGDPTVNPCAACHKGLVNKKFVHGPAGVWGCSSCHDGGTLPSRWQVRSKDAELCNECHFDKVDEFKKNTFVHGPVGVGLCTICHDPHATDNQSQLVTTVNKLCLGCHTTIREGEHVVRGVSGNGHPLKGRSDPLRPDKPFSCVSCHNPHGGENRSLFIKKTKGRFQLCQNCHQK